MVSNKTTRDQQNRKKRSLQEHHISVYRLFLSYSSLHVLRAPEPFIRVPYERVLCPGNMTPKVPKASSSRPSQSGQSTVDGSSVSHLDDTPAIPVNQLSDITLLMGDSRAANNDAFYNYARRNFLSGDKRDLQKLNWTLDDFKGDGFCYEKLLHSFGTRMQLSKLVIDYDDKHGAL